MYDLLEAINEEKTIQELEFQSKNNYFNLREPILFIKVNYKFKILKIKKRYIKNKYFIKTKIIYHSFNPYS